MASCVRCGKPIGLFEYTWGDSRQLGLCRACRMKEKWCDDCEFMHAVIADNSSVLRCTKHGSNLSDLKDRKRAAGCRDYKPKIADMKPKPKKDDEEKPEKGLDKKQGAEA